MSDFAQWSFTNPLASFAKSDATLPPLAAEKEAAAPKPALTIDESAAAAYNKARGYSKSLWKQIQETVGCAADGIPGVNTAKAIARWQADHGLSADGKCGSGTLAKMGLSTSSSSAATNSSGASAAAPANAQSDISDKVGNLRVKVNTNVARHDTSHARVRNTVGSLAKGDIVSYYKVNGRVTTSNRYYISSNGCYGWVPVSAVEATDDAAKPKAAVSGVNARSTNYKQFDARWGNMFYGKDKSYSTYSEGGCGPTSMANIVATMKDSSVTPDVIGSYSTSIGARPKSGGTIGDLLFKNAASKYGLSVTHYSAGANALKGLETMKGASGKYAIVNVGNGSKWGGSGHFMTIYGFDGTNVYIDDPNTWNDQDDAKRFCNNDIKNGLWVFS